MGVRSEIGKYFIIYLREPADFVDKEISGGCIMTPLRTILVLLIVLAAVLLAAGCVEQSKYADYPVPTKTIEPITLLPTTEGTPVKDTVSPTTSETPIPVSPADSMTTTPDWSSKKYVPGEVIVRYDANLTKEQFFQISSSLNQKINASNPVDASVSKMPYIQLVHLPPDVSVESAVAFYEKNKSVEWAQPDFI